MSRNVADWIGGFLEYTENSEPPYMFRLWTAISVLAGSLQRKCYLPWGPLTFYPNLYVVLVAPSGKCRKGTAMTFGHEMLDTIGVRMAAEATTRESLIRELKNSTNTVIDPKTGKPSFHSSLTIYSQELTVFLGHGNFQLLSDLTDWYDCRNRWTYRTKTQGTDDIVGVYVNLFGATTPEILQIALPQDAIGGGLTSRIIFVYANKKGKIVPTPFLSKDELLLRSHLITDLERIMTVSGKFSVSKDFVERWIDWYTKQENNPPFSDDRFNGYIERRPNHVLKLSMIMSASRSDSLQITLADLNRAIITLEETERVMPQAFRGIGRSAISDLVTRVLTWVASFGEVDKSEIMKHFYHDADSKTMDMVIETLISMNYVKRITTSNSERFRYVGEDEQ